MRPITSNCREIIGLSKRKTHPIIRFRKPMLYPLSYEGITGFSSPRRSFQHNLSTTFQELLLTTLDHSPLFKHVDTSRRIPHLLI